MAFVFPQKVRFQHCDPAGIVFYPRYFEMLNATIEEWFATRLGLSFAEIHGPMGMGVPTAAHQTPTSTAPSRLGERLDFALDPGSPRRLERDPRRRGHLRRRGAGQLRHDPRLDTPRRTDGHGPGPTRCAPGSRRKCETKEAHHDRDDPARRMEGAEGLRQRRARRGRAAPHRRPDRLERRPGLRGPRLRRPDGAGARQHRRDRPRRRRRGRAHRPPHLVRHRQARVPRPRAARSARPTAASWAATSRR